MYIQIYAVHAKRPLQYLLISCVVNAKRNDTSKCYQNNVIANTSYVGYLTRFVINDVVVQIGHWCHGILVFRKTAVELNILKKEYS